MFQGLEHTDPEVLHRSDGTPEVSQIVIQGSGCQMNRAFQHWATVKADIAQRRARMEIGEYVSSTKFKAEMMWTWYANMQAVKRFWEDGS